MKKMILWALLAFRMSTGMQAQTDVSFGFKGGLNVTKFWFDNRVLKQDNQEGFFFGPTLRVASPVTGWGFDVSALYDQRQAKLYDDRDGITLQQQQVAIPLNLRYEIGLADAAAFFLFAGPQIGLNIGDKSKSFYDNAANWRLKTSAFSVNMGFGVMLLKHFQVHANYNVACGTTGEVTFNSAANRVFNDVSGKKKGRANAWQVGMVYYF